MSAELSEKVLDDKRSLHESLMELSVVDNGTVGTDSKDSSRTKVRDLEKKRDDYLEWPEYFMAVAFLAAMRSKDPCTQVGACITDSNNRIVGVGYNGMPIGCSDEILPWGKNSSQPLETKYMYVCHAEMNAIMNKNTADLRGCTLYVALFPCNECAKLIIQAGIKQVVYMSDKHKNKPSTEASKMMFSMAGVKCQQFVPKNSKIVIDFEEIDWNISI
ncbi:deoxycytidylate deaminase-like [Daphnia pulicaria]|uniref:deoxycytidylate deaminase-like n=1 Tax=Daphnia pulicaria TaxID=35523 RepID=UPI001EEB6E61|nr:deoxycytidylate deaminase-like [Daphnia pulicaria]